MQLDIWLYKCDFVESKSIRSSYAGTLAARSLVEPLQREMHDGQSNLRDEIRQTLNEVTKFNPQSFAPILIRRKFYQAIEIIMYHFKTYPKELFNYE